MITNATTTTSTPTTQPIAIATGENLPPPPPELRPDLVGASRSSRRLRCATLSLAMPCGTVATAGRGHAGAAACAANGLRQRYRLRRAAPAVALQLAGSGGKVPGACAAPDLGDRRTRIAHRLRAVRR